LSAHESHVSPHTLEKLPFVDSSEVDKLFIIRIIDVVMVYTHQEVFILQCVTGSSLALDFSVDHTSFQIENVPKFLFVLELAGVFHQHYVAVLDIPGVDCVYSEDFREQTILVCFVVLPKSW